MESRRIEYQPLNQLLKAPSNPKKHDVDLVQRSISTFGYVAPAIVDERTGRLVVGHGRTEALQALRASGAQPPDGVRQDPDGDWLVPVIRGWASKDDGEAAAYLVADNRHTELGGWDHDSLAQLLDEIGDPDLVDITGWDLDELAASLDSVEEMPEAGDADTESPANKPMVWGVAITCRTEQEQVDLIERLSEDGYEVRALM